MIQKARRRTRRKRDQAVDVRLTVQVRFGREPQDAVTIIEDRRVPVVGGILRYRDRIIRGFLRVLLRAAALQPKVLRVLLPLGRGGHHDGESGDR